MSANDGRLDATPPADSLACVACRNRKLKCDRSRPACTRCLKLNVDCAYPESRRKPTSKRRNVKELEERLAQVEDLLREAGGPKGLADAFEDSDPTIEQVDVDLDYAQAPATEDVFLQGIDYTFGNDSNGIGQGSETAAPEPLHWDSGAGQSGPSVDPLFGQLMGLGGLSEPLPPFEVMEELNRIFFTRHQHFIPIIHPARYLHAFYSAPHKKPPMCLQYAVWALASNGDGKYHSYHDVFYRRARQYLEADEMKGFGENFITVAHAQAWCLVGTDEAKSMLFTRAAMSCARATQLSYMMGLHRLDCGPEDSSPTLAPPKDWAELEERRRTFWGIFCIDSHCSIATGWPHLIDVAEAVTTRLPASESAFQNGEQVDSPTLHEALQGSPYSSFAGAVIVCHLFDLVNSHVHRQKPTDNPQNFDYGPFWSRHRNIDNTLSGIFMFLPECFRLPENNQDPTAVHTNLNLHAAVICLHHGAIDQIEKHKLSEEARKASEDRLVSAAQEIVNIAKLTSHISQKMKSSLAALSLYCAASVYVYLAKTRKEPVQVENLDFLLAAMEAISREHRIAQGFLRQATLDIQKNEIANIIRLARADTLSAQFGTIAPNSIPMLARSQISRHSSIASPLPGRLPLGNPVGRVSSSNMCEAESRDGVPVAHGFVPVINEKTGGEARRPDQNRSEPQQQQRAQSPGAAAGTKRRRRTSASPTTTQPWNTSDAQRPGMVISPSDYDAARMSTNAQAGNRMVFPFPAQPGLSSKGLQTNQQLPLEAQSLGDGGTLQLSSVPLPHRTNTPPFSRHADGTQTSSLTAVQARRPANSNTEGETPQSSASSSNGAARPSVSLSSTATTAIDDTASRYSKEWNVDGAAAAYMPATTSTTQFSQTASMMMMLDGSGDNINNNNNYNNDNNSTIGGDVSWIDISVPSLDGQQQQQQLDWEALAATFDADAI